MVEDSGVGSVQVYFWILNFSCTIGVSRETPQGVFFFFLASLQKLELQEKKSRQISFCLTDYLKSEKHKMGWRFFSGEPDQKTEIKISATFGGFPRNPRTWYLYLVVSRSLRMVFKTFFSRNSKNLEKNKFQKKLHNLGIGNYVAFLDG